MKTKEEINKAFETSRRSHAQNQDFRTFVHMMVLSWVLDIAPPSCRIACDEAMNADFESAERYAQYNQKETERFIKGPRPYPWEASSSQNEAANTTLPSRTTPAKE